ncbi:putative cytochrome P450 [Arabidopsis thaliana]
MLRKICINKMLSSATLDSNSFSALRRQETRQTVRYLADQARAGLAVNVGEQIFVTILNVVTQMLWGETVADDEERERVGAEFLELITEIIDVVGKPNVSDFFPVLSRFDLQGLAKRVRRSAQRMDRMFDRIISQRVGMDKGSKGNDGNFLMVLLNAKDEDENMSMNHVKALLMDMVLGGTDTSLNTIEFAMAELINKPEIMKRAQQELDKVVGKNNIVEEKHITKLPYILSIMKETLRLHPALPLLIPRCPSETTVIGGYTIPNDSKVFINVWAIHRNPNVWENPLEFNPDRFLDKGYDFSGNDYSYFPFGSGRRICAGMAMAEKVVLYNLATLLHSFDWRIGEGEKVELEEKFGILLKLKNPLDATPVLRLSDPNLFL